MSSVPQIDIVKFWAFFHGNPTAWVMLAATFLLWSQVISLV